MSPPVSIVGRTFGFTTRPPVTCSTRRTTYWAAVPRSGSEDLIRAPWDRTVPPEASASQPSCNSGGKPTLPPKSQPSDLIYEELWGFVKVIYMILGMLYLVKWVRKGPRAGAMNVQGELGHCPRWAPWPSQASSAAPSAAAGGGAC